MWLHSFYAFLSFSFSRIFGARPGTAVTTRRCCPFDTPTAKIWITSNLGRRRNVMEASRFCMQLRNAPRPISKSTFELHGWLVAFLLRPVSTLLWRISVLILENVRKLQRITAENNVSVAGTLLKLLMFCSDLWLRRWLGADTTTNVCST